MFFGNVAELEVTKDKEQANRLLNNEWFLLEVKAATNDEFVFLLGRGDYPRKAIFHRRDYETSTSPKAI